MGHPVAGLLFDGVHFGLDEAGLAEPAAKTAQGVHAVERRVRVVGAGGQVAEAVGDLAVEPVGRVLRDHRHVVPSVRRPEEEHAPGLQDAGDLGGDLGGVLDVLQDEVADDGVVARVGHGEVPPPVDERPAEEAVRADRPPDVQPVDRPEVLEEERRKGIARASPRVPGRPTGGRPAGGSGRGIPPRRHATWGIACRTGASAGPATAHHAAASKPEAPTASAPRAGRSSHHGASP